MAVGPRPVDGEKRFDRSRKEREKQTRRQLDSFDFIPGHPRLTNQPLLTSRGCRPLSPRTRGRMWTNFHQYFIIISSFAFSAVLIFMWPSISRPSAQQPFSRCHVATSTGDPHQAPPPRQQLPHERNAVAHPASQHGQSARAEGTRETRGTRLSLPLAAFVDQRNGLLPAHIILSTGGYRWPVFPNILHGDQQED